MLRANLHPLKYILQEQPKENEAPQVSGSKPWHAHVRLQRWSGDIKIKKQTWEEVRPIKEGRYSLFIEGAATTGRRAVLKEGSSEFQVETVCHWPRDSLPRQDKNHQHSSVTAMPWPLADQAQQLLLFTVTPNHLSDCERTQTVRKLMSALHEVVRIYISMSTTYPFSYWTPLGTLSFLPSVNNNFYPYCISFSTIPEIHNVEKRNLNNITLDKIFPLCIPWWGNLRQY